MKKIFILLSLAILMVSCSTANPKDKDKEKSITSIEPKEPVRQSKYEIKTKTCEIKWVNPTTPYEDINTKIDEKLKKEKDVIMNMGNEFLLDMEEENETTSLLPFILEGNYEIIENNLDIYSFIYKIYEYTGGAHGEEEYIIYNILKKTGQPVNLEELLGVGYKNKIIKIINSKIKNREDVGGKQFNEIDYLVKSISNLEDSNYYFKEKSIIIVFPEYVLAPYSSGKIEFDIPIIEFK